MLQQQPLSQPLSPAPPYSPPPNLSMKSRGFCTPQGSTGPEHNPQGVSWAFPGILPAPGLLELAAGEILGSAGPRPSGPVRSFINQRLAY